MSTMKPYLIIYEPLRSIRTVFINEDAIINAYFNLPYKRNYISGFAEFLDWYDGVLRHKFGSVAVTESGYPILLWNSQSWLMIEASDIFDAVKKAKPIFHERIKH